MSFNLSGNGTSFVTKVQISAFIEEVSQTCHSHLWSVHLLLGDMKQKKSLSLISSVAFISGRSLTGALNMRSKEVSKQVEVVIGSLKIKYNEHSNETEVSYPINSLVNS